MALGAFGMSDGGIPCGSAGCAVTAKIGELLGVEKLLWGMAFAFFLWLALLALTCVREDGRPWWKALDVTLCGALAFDGLLLAAMLLFAPCRNCLMVAALLGACAFLAFGSRMRLLTGAWLALFLMNVGVLANSALMPDPVWGSEDAKIRLYASPTCGKCVEAMRKYHSDAAIYLVARSVEDMRKIAAMRTTVEGGGMFGAALKGLLWDDEEPVTLGVAIESLQSLARVLSAGARTLPFFEFRGLPSLKDGSVEEGCGEEDGSCRKKPFTPSEKQLGHTLKNPFGD